MRDRPQEVLYAVIYAVPSWWGITAEKDRAKIERLYNRLKRMGYLPADAHSIPALVDQAEAGLFRSIHLNPAHVLRHLLPPTVQHAYRLRPRPHNYVLPPKDDKNFIPRHLYKLKSKAQPSLVTPLGLLTQRSVSH